MPRTASNLLVKILALDQQPDVLYKAPGGYYFSDANDIYDGELGVKYTPMSTWTEEAVKRVKVSTSACFTALTSYMNDAKEQGKIAFVKEHVAWMLDPSFACLGSDETQDVIWDSLSYQGETARGNHNLTVVPDAFLKTWHPTFLIRHPALVFPSLYRAMRDVGAIDSQRFLNPRRAAKNKSRFTYYWTRRSYDLYVDLLREGKDDISGDSWPLTLEADDIMTKPEVLAKWVKLAGLDGSKLRYKWDTATAEDIAKFKGKFVNRTIRYLNTIGSSTSVRTDKVAGEIDIAKEALKWREEFGEDVGDQMEEHVRDAMDDYEYLKARRLKA